MQRSILLTILMMIGFILNACDETKHTSPSPGVGPEAWVVNTLGRTASTVYFHNNSVEVNAVALGSSPNDIVIPGLGMIGYVVNSGDNNIQIINLAARQTTATIQILLGLNPWALAVDENNSRGYVTNLLTGNLSILDLNTHQEIDTLQIGTSPEGVCIDYTRQILFVTDVNLVWPVYGQGYVKAFSLSNDSLLATIPVATNPQVVVPGPDGKIHVVCTGDFASKTGQIQIIDPESMVVVDSIMIGSYPGSLVFTPDGLGYLGVSPLSGGGEILSYHGDTHQIIHGAANPITLPSGVWDITAMQSIDYGNILACCFGTDQLFELDGDGNLVGAFTVGDGPVAVALWMRPTDHNADGFTNTVTITGSNQ
jgi:YVTN family beta-propeller protein